MLPRGAQQASKRLVLPERDVKPMKVTIFDIRPSKAPSFSTRVSTEAPEAACSHQEVAKEPQGAENSSPTREALSEQYLMLIKIHFEILCKPQVAPKKLPRGPRDSPKRHQDLTRGPQMLQSEAKILYEIQPTQLCPGGTQEVPKSIRRDLQVPRGPYDAPRGSKELPQKVSKRLHA